MNKRVLGILGITLISVLIILIIVLPASGVGNTGPRDGVGNQGGYHAHQYGSGQQSGSGTGSCISEKCPHYGSSGRDGARMECEAYANGHRNGMHSGSESRGHGYSMKG
ncbi:hypothetical protein [Methanospirillum lacunae]|uniref:Uncharacterized protein n=1 Tax=Methanospirillum lacunae TaxID=668570 RepID=A0A2V2MZS1_9EURY|nr:hypothetical protein [Methanospirillum lacunae]PWR70886.1 hypothetical protein DK846_12910 [Methanospirillum lacunae]